MFINKPLYEILPYIYVIIGIICFQFTNEQKIITLASLVLIISGVYFLYCRYQFRKYEHRYVHGRLVKIGKRK